MPTNINVLVLPGGKLPAQGRPGEDVAYDFFIRAIVDPHQVDASHHGRKTLWDLQSKPKLHYIDRISREKDGIWEYMLSSGQEVCVGIGIILGGHSIGWCGELLPRSKTANQSVELKNYFGQPSGGVPIEPTYRGEPVAKLKNDGSDPIWIYHGYSPGQIKFQAECLGCDCGGFSRPRLVEVKTYAELGETSRGKNWNGSSDNPPESTKGGDVVGAIIRMMR